MASPSHNGTLHPITRYGEASVLICDCYLNGQCRAEIVRDRVGLSVDLLRVKQRSVRPHDLELYRRHDDALKFFSTLSDKLLCLQRLTSQLCDPIREFQIDRSCAGCVNRDLIQNIFGIIEVKERGSCCSVRDRDTILNLILFHPIVHQCRTVVNCHVREISLSLYKLLVILKVPIIIRICISACIIQIRRRDIPDIQSTLI